MTIYLNACGHGLSDPSVAARMVAHLTREAEIGEARAMLEVAEELDGVREAVAALIGGAAAQTGLAPNTSTPWEALVARLPLAGKRVIVAAHEWGTNIAMLRRMAANFGGWVEVVPASEALDPAAWAARMGEDVAALFAPMVTSIAGIRYPIAEIGALARPENTLFVVDAAQAVGQGPVAVEALGCDALVATTRKWVRGPRETGLYWLNERASAMTGLHVVPSDMNAALRLGQGVAIRAVEVPNRGLTEAFRAAALDLGLESLSRNTGAVTLRIGHDHAPAVRAALEAAEIMVKWPDPIADEPESEVTLADGALLRISPHVYNTANEIEQVAIAIKGGLV